MIAMRFIVRIVSEPQRFRYRVPASRLDDQAMPFMSVPRSAPRLLVRTFELYRRYPLLFLVLAARVIVPYELIALAATGTGSFSRADANPEPGRV
jgi:hypothetical protein